MVEASQGCTGRPHLKTTDPGVATGTLSTWDLEAGGSGVGGQPEYPLRFRNYFHLRSQHIPLFEGKISTLQLPSHKENALA